MESGTKRPPPKGVALDFRRRRGAKEGAVAPLSLGSKRMCKTHRMKINRNLPGIPDPIRLCFIILITVFSYPLVAQQSIWDSVRTEVQYFDALAAADSTTYTWEFEYPFLLLLSEQEIESYHKIDLLESRKDLIETYWKRWNPNPLLSDNDWLMVFIQRCTYSRKHYDAPNPPYIDDRGKYCIRYGRPTNFYQDGGGQRTAALFKNPDVYRYVRDLGRGFAPQIYYSVYPNESWVYRDIGLDYVVHFVKQGSAYEEVNSLTKALTTGMSKNVIWYWSELVQSRRYLSPALAETANDLLVLESDMITAAYTSRRPTISEGGRMPDRIIRENMRRLENDEETARKDPPAFLYFPDRAVNRLKFFSDIAQFRGPEDDGTLVDIVLRSAFHKNILPKKIPDDLETIVVKWECMFRDLEFRPTTREEVTSLYFLEDLQPVDFPYAVNRLSFKISPQKGDLTINIQEAVTGTLGYSKEPFTIRDFTGSDLMISGIQFFTQISDSSQGKLFPIIKKESMRFVPYPFLEFRQEYPVFCYFEIYNLQKALISDEFDVSLRVSTQEKKGGVFRLLTRWVGGGQDAAVSLEHRRNVTENTVRELLSIDFSNLPRGTYLLEVTVTDALNDAIRTNASKEIVIADTSQE